MFVSITRKPKGGAASSYQNTKGELILLKSFRRSRKKGFTLVELLVVVAILAILSVALLPSILGYSDKARDARAIKDVRNFATVIDAFAATDGDYPEASLDTENLCSIASVMQSKGIKWTGDETGVVDPWNNPYYYDLTEDYYCIASAGKDGTLNTSDDICNIGGKVSKKASGLDENAIPSAVPGNNPGGGGPEHQAEVPDGYIGIYTPEQLASIGNDPDYPLDGNYIVMADLNLSGYNNWTPIANQNAFEGIFDGNNYTISHLQIGATADMAGLFCRIVGEATLKNVILADVDLDITQDGGALVGQTFGGTITECSVSGELSGTGRLGGLAGEANDSEISGCANNATIDGTSKAGGIAAYAGNTNITDCTNTGSIQGLCVAGIIADYYDGNISNCHNTGSIVGTDNYTGGVIGYCDGISISDCSNTGPIQGDWATAGVVAYIASGDVSSCYNEADITATGGHTGGLVGYTSGQVTDSYSIGNVTGTGGSVGGLAGMSSTVTNCYAEGDVDGGGDCVGGLVGQCDGAISDSYATGNVTGAGDVVGGLAGIADSTVTNSYALGNVTGTGAYVGGLLGYSGGEVSNSYAVGDVDGGYYVGGLVGQCDGAISDSYATGNVTGAGDYVGGLAGTAGSTVTNSYALGNVTGTGACVGGLAGGAYGQVSYCYSIGLATTTAEGSSVGGLIGDGGNNVISSYYNSDPAGQINNGIGTPLTAAQMKQQANFDGWDFDNVWSIDNSYPFLINNEQIPHPGI
jgi:type II secretion system protein G